MVHWLAKLCWDLEVSCPYLEPYGEYFGVKECGIVSKFVYVGDASGMKLSTQPSIWVGCLMWGWRYWIQLKWVNQLSYNMHVCVYSARNGLRMSNHSTQSWMVCCCVHYSQTFGEIEQELNETINSFNYTSDSFLDNQTRSALNDFTDAGVEAINITGIMIIQYMYMDGF